MLPPQYGVALVGHGERVGERFEVLRRILVAGPGDAHVFGHHRVPLLLELLGQRFFQRLEADAQHA